MAPGNSKTRGNTGLFRFSAPPPPPHPAPGSSAVLPTGKEGPWGARGGWGRRAERSEPAATLADQGTDRSWRLWAVSSPQEVPGPADAQLKMNLGAISQRCLGEGPHHSPGIHEFMLSSAATTPMCLSVCLCHTHLPAGGRNMGDVATVATNPLPPTPPALPFCELPSPPSPLLASGNRPWPAVSSPRRPGPRGGAGRPVSFLTRCRSSPLKCPPPCSSRGTHVPGEPPPGQAAGWGLRDTPGLSVLK